MTYFGFLVVARYDHRRGVRLPEALRSWPAPLIILGHVAVAVLYTTPWDNYLVATRVWWYDPKLVTGVVLWYVPLEEYCFFVLQTLLTGSWLLLLARHYPAPDSAAIRPFRLRVVSTLIIGLIWLIFVGVLAFGWRPGTYMGLLFAWALPPVMIQTAFGADILWRRRKIILLSVVPMTLYLAASDKLAITTGTWTISPEQSVGINLLGRLPVEELLFFMMTNVLITLGITLVSSVESKQRAARYFLAVRKLFRNGAGHPNPAAERVERAN
jgi:lycopene cyclase domain-containing protein